jgi:hypothetical protein
MRWTTVVAGAVLAVGLVAHPAAAVFDPANYAGTWTGTWKNNTFKVSGTLGATVTASLDGQTMTVDYQISNLFNCGPASLVRILTRGVEFTESGMSFTATNSAWGTSTVEAVSKKKLEKITITGTPTCRSDIESFTARAKLEATRL